MYPKATIVTDASPTGLGAILLINNKAVKALATKVTETDAFQLNFTDCWKESELQGIVETMAVAIKTWTITGCRHHRRPWVVVLALQPTKFGPACADASGLPHTEILRVKEKELRSLSEPPLKIIHPQFCHLFMHFMSNLIQFSLLHCRLKPWSLFYELVGPVVLPLDHPWTQRCVLGVAGAILVLVVACTFIQLHKKAYSRSCDPLPPEQAHVRQKGSASSSRHLPIARF